MKSINTNLNLTLCCMLLVLFASIPATAQHAPVQENQLASVSKLIGKWEGAGWIYVGKEKKTFSQTEIVEEKLEGSILVVEGIGKSTEEAEAGRLIHDAYGIISFNSDMDALSMLYFSKQQGKGEVKIDIVKTDVISWKMIQGGRIIRFTDDMSTDGKWTEVGEVSMDEGKTWFQFFEMSLERVE